MDEVDEVIRISNELISDKVFKYQNSSIVFDNCEFAEGVVFKGYNNRITFNINHVQRKSADLNDFAKMTFNEKGTSLKIKITDFQTATLRLSNNFIFKELMLVFEELKYLDFDECDINTITIQGYNKALIGNINCAFLNNPSITFENFTFNGIGFNDSGNFKSLTFNNLTPSKSDYYSLDFRHVDILIIKDFNVESLSLTFKTQEYINFIDISVKSIRLGIKYFYDPDRPITKNRTLFINSLKIDGDIFFNLFNLHIKNIEIEGVYHQSNLIEKSKIGNLTFYEFSTNENFELKTVELFPDSRLIICRSVLDNVILRPSFLHNFTEIEFSSSSVEGLRLIDFKEVNVDCISSTNFYEGTSDVIGFLRFLKNYVNQQSNLNSYHKYKAAEYNEVLKSDPNLDFRERFTLLFNQFTNYHSTDWMRALKLFLILFLFHISLVTTYLKCSGQIDNVADVSRIFHYFISPINFLSELEEYSFPNFVYFLDVLYHLCIGVVIYQFIAAFRKFNK